MSEAIPYDRRRFIGSAVTAMAGAGLIASRLGELERLHFVETKSSTKGSIGPLRQIDDGDLNVRHTEAGPSNGPPVILLHGSSYGINSDIDVAPLATRGYRVIVPYVRRPGTSRLKSSDTMRDGQQTAAPSHVMALMASLKIEEALVGGFDEGARTVEVMAALWPQRLKGIVPISGSPVVTLATSQRPLPPNEELAWWYRYYVLRDGVA